MVKSVQSRLVYAGDTFEIEYGLDDRLIHIPQPDAPNYGNNNAIRGAYCVVTLSNGAKTFEWMNAAEIKARADKAAAGNGPWSKHYGEMARKTVTRLALKPYPLSRRANAVMQLQAAAESGGRIAVDDTGSIDVDYEVTTEREHPAPTDGKRRKGGMAQARPVEPRTAHSDAPDDLPPVYDGDAPPDANGATHDATAGKPHVTVSQQLVKRFTDGSEYATNLLRAILRAGLDPVAVLDDLHYDRIIEVPPEQRTEHTLMFTTACDRLTAAANA